jgi:hypothetical protein
MKRPRTRFPLADRLATASAAGFFRLLQTKRSCPRFALFDRRGSAAPLGTGKEWGHLNPALLTAVSGGRPAPSASVFSQHTCTSGLSRSACLRVHLHWSYRVPVPEK